MKDLQFDIQSFAEIINYSDESLVAGTSGADKIDNSGDYVTIDSGAGNDTVYNSGSGSWRYYSSMSSSYYENYVSIDGGAGSDEIYNSGSYVQIDGGAGDDTIEQDSSIYYTSIGSYHYGYSNTINGGAGNDVVSLSSDSAINLIQYKNGDGNDTVYGLNESDTLQISGAKYTTVKSGNDIIFNVGSGKITVKDGADTKLRIDGKLSISGEYISNYQNNSLVSGTARNDSIFNEGNNVTIQGNAGDDTIQNYNYNYNGYGSSVSSSYYGMYVSIDAGAGDDFINNSHSPGNSLSSSYYGKYVTINGGDGNDTVKSISANSKIYGGNGDDSVYNTGENVTIDGGAGNDTIANDSDYVSIDGGAGDDSIANYGYSLSIDAGAGDDYIYNFYGDSVTIDTGAGNDYIYNVGNDDSINGGAGNDTIDQYGYSFSYSLSSYYYGYNNTINGGAGDDVVSLSGDSKYNLIQYNNGDGNDTVYGLNEDDTLQISGAKYTSTKSGNDIKINVGNGSILIKDAVYTDLNIVGESSEDTTGKYIDNSTNNTVITGTAKDDTIYNSGNYVKIDGGAGNDNITQYGYSSSTSMSSYYYGYNNTINGGAGNDKISFSSYSKYNLIQYASGDGNDTVYGLNEDDTLQISGAKYTTTKSGNDIKINVGNGSILIKDAANIAVNIDGTFDGGSDTIPPDDLPVGITVKKDVLTASNKFKGTEINLADYPNVTKINAAALSQAVNIVGNNNNNSIKGGKGADTISGGSGKNTLTGGAGKDVFVYAGGNDLITDYKVGEDKINLNLAEVTKSSVKGSDVILTTDEGTLTIKGTKDKVVTFVDDSGKTTDKIFFAGTSYNPLEDGLKYDAKRTVLTASAKFKGTEIDLGDYLETVAKVNTSAVKQGVNIVGNENNNSIKAGKGADTISGGSGKNTLYGGAGNDSIIGGNDNDKILGEAGNDTLNGGAGKNTLTGGAGADVFVYGGGNDLITDYKAGEDKIKLNLANVTKSSVKGSDVILTTAEGTLTIKGAKDKVVTFADDSGKTTDKIFFADMSYSPLEDGLKYDAKRTVLTASNKFKGTEIDLGDYLETVTKVNASAVKQGVNIVGNENNDSIKGGKGADTISGGSGKNTLTGGAGADVFIYGGGNDLITDYKAGEDSIKINGKISGTSYKGKDVIFTVGNGTLTVKGMKGKEISVTDSSGKTQIYSKTLDLIHDNNFVSDEFCIDSITDKKFAVTQIETADNSKEFNAESLITYSENK